MSSHATDLSVYAKSSSSSSMFCWWFVQVESEESTALSERPDEVLKVWDVESSHKYENNQHTSQVKLPLAHFNLTHLAAADSPVLQAVSLLKVWPRAGSRVVRIDLLRFLDGCHKRWLNQA